jgi:serpin B
MTRDLAEMGMAPAMSGGADFTGMVKSCGCAISQVVQATRLEVDEKGTTAAAATGVVGTTAISLDQLHMVVDHPFLTAIIDNASGAPIFLGVVGRP